MRTSSLWIAVAVLTTAASQAAFADLLYVSSRGTDEILRFDSNTGSFVDVFVSAGSGGLDEPSGLTFGPDGNLYAASRSTLEVLRYDGTTGAFIDVFVPATPFFVGIAIEFGPDGNLYVMSYSIAGSSLVRYDGATGGLIGQVISLPDTTAFTDFEFGPDGNIYIATFNAGILRFDGTTFAFLGTFVPPTPSGTMPPPGAADVAQGIEFGFDGKLYVHVFGGESVKRYDGVTGRFLDLFFDSPSASGSIASPAGIAFGPEGDLFISKQTGANQNRVLRIDRATGSLSMVLDPTGIGCLVEPADIAFQPRLATEYGCGLDPDGSLSVLGGVPSIGAGFGLGIDNPLGTQAPGSLPLLLVSTAPDPAYPCGLAVPGLGMGPGPAELLIDLTPPNPLLPILAGLPWVGPGTPAPIGVPIPPSPQLVNQVFYFQGALFDPSLPSSPRFRLTGALAIRVTL